MYKYEQYAKCGKVKSQIKRECVQEGESLEEMIRRCVESNEPIEATAPMIYTEEADGVQPQFDPRSDRFDIALDAIDKYQKSATASSENKNEKDAQPGSQADDQNKGNG